MNKASDFRISILGCGSAIPTTRHNPSSQVVDYRGNLFMIDCGEGTQAMFRRMEMRMSRLRHIFISHLHGDHCLGLPGLLSTMSLQNVEGSLTVHIHPQGIEMFAGMLDFFCPSRSFDIRWEPLDPGARSVVYEDRNLVVEAFPLYHRIDCNGFIFREKEPLRHLRPDMLEFYDVPVAHRQSLKEGADLVLPDGRVIANERLTRDPEPARSYAYASDTMADSRVAEAVAGVDLLYHEATYADDLASKARERGHSTARQAGEIARRASAKRLMIGHYSKRYHALDTLRDEATAAFGAPVIAATEKLVIDL